MTVKKKKKKQVAQRASITHLSNPIPKTLCSFSPTPMMLHIKFDNEWQLASEIYKFKSVKFSSLRASNSKMSGLIPPKIELDRAFTPVLVTSNFDDELCYW